MTIDFISKKAHHGLFSSASLKRLGCQNKGHCGDRKCSHLLHICVIGQPQKKQLDRTVGHASKIIDCKPPPISDIYETRIQKRLRATKTKTYPEVERVLKYS